MKITVKQLRSLIREAVEEQMSEADVNMNLKDASQAAQLRGQIINMARKSGKSDEEIAIALGMDVKDVNKFKRE